jgi:hypothetical protein
MIFIKRIKSEKNGSINLFRGICFEMVVLMKHTIEQENISFPLLEELTLIPDKSSVNSNSFSDTETKPEYFMDLISLRWQFEKKK